MRIGTTVILWMVLAYTHGQTIPHRTPPFEGPMRSSSAIWEWKQTKVNLGFVQVDDTIPHTFRLINSGEKPFRIVQAQSHSKVCYVLIPQVSIQPGMESWVKVLATPSREGAFDCLITVGAQDNQAITILRLEGIAYRP